MSPDQHENPGSLCDRCGAPLRPLNEVADRELTGEPANGNSLPYKVVGS
jgi:hypothetical protein